MSKSEEDKIFIKRTLKFNKYLNDNFYKGMNGWTMNGWGAYSNYRNGKVENILKDWIDNGEPLKP